MTVQIEGAGFRPREGRGPQSRFRGRLQRELQNRAHFIGVAARQMRRILIDYSRSRLAAKRGGGRRLSLDEAPPLFSDARSADLIALDDALNALEKLDPRLSRIVELRYFGGLTVEETAEALSLSPNTVKKEWAAARAWLQARLSGREP